MNKIKTLIIIILSVISISNVKALSLPEFKNENTNYSAVLEDDAELLTEEELNKLQEEMKSLTEHGNIAFKTISSNSTTTEAYASSYYHTKFGTKSGTVLLIDMDNRYIYLFSDGENYNIVTKDKATIITDNVYRYASNEEYYECARIAFSQVNTLLQGGKISEPMRHISNILIAITVAFFINFIIILVNTSLKKAKEKEIIDNCTVNFNISNVNAHQVGTHREYSPRSSSSSGGGRSSGGGGRSSGGGGGHRF